MLEYNADTPTSLLEAAISQWNWKETVQPEFDQWNSLHERLVEQFRLLRTQTDQWLHVGWIGDDWGGEDAVTCAYLSDVAHEAGWQIVGLTMDQIGWNPSLGFLDADDRPIETMFKLYPWEWMFHEEFGQYASARSAAPAGSSRCGSRCCRTRRCWRSCGRCSPGTRICSRPTSTNRPG